MTRTGSKAVLVVAVLVGFSAIGCTNYKEQAESLQIQNQELREEYEALQSEYAAIRNNETSLDKDAASARADLTAVNTDLARAMAEIDRLNDRPELVVPQAAEGWEQGLTAVRASVGGDVLFSAGRATLTTQGKAVLDKIAKELNGAYAGMPVRVYGYSDNDPIKRTRRVWKDNLDLSANRAMAVTRHLISRGVAAVHVETVAMGEAHYNPSLGKAGNRRVEIVVIQQ